MFVTFRRVLPEGKETDVAVNTDQVIWVQATDGNTVTIFPTAGPELLVKKSDATNAFFSGQNKP